MSEEEKDAPEIKDSPGKTDNYAALAILVIPFVLVAATVFTAIGLVASGIIPVNVEIAGSLAASSVFKTIVAPLTLVFGGLLALTWMLALMKVFGVNPVVWLIQRIANLAQNYNPGQNEN
jgi:hypothetical protein